MRPEVNLNQFEISNYFEKSFCLHGNFTMANLEIKPLPKIVPFTRRFRCSKFRAHAHLLGTNMILHNFYSLWAFTAYMENSLRFEISLSLTCFSLKLTKVKFAPR